MSKFCAIFITEKSSGNFYNQNRECQQCSIERSLKRYYENKDKLSNQ